MLDQNSHLRLPLRSNTETTEHVINGFERNNVINKSRSYQFRDELLQKGNREALIQAFPQSRRRYRYHSVAYVSIDHITSYEKNLNFLKKMKQKTAINSEFLVADCLEIYGTLSEGPHKDTIYDLIGLIIEFKDIDVVKLRESECEKIFRKIQSLINLLNYTRRERAASIECQPKEDIYDIKFNKEAKLKGRIKFLLARFEFIIATLGHFIHYNKIANTPQKKVFNRNANARGSTILFNPTFTSMEIKSKSESPKRHSFRQEIKSRKESLDGYNLGDRMQSYREEGDDALKESKFQQVKQYFKWKLEKWKDQDLEEIVLVCRICSKSMSAKIMKKHSTHCKKVAEEERIMKEFSKKIAEIVHAANKEKRNTNVDLLLEKKQLMTLKAQSNWQKDSEYNDFFDCLTPTPMLFRGNKSEFTFEAEASLLMDQKPLDNKVQFIREELKSLDLAPTSVEKETAASPKEGPSSLTSPFDTDSSKPCFPSSSILNSPMDYLKPPRRKLSRGNSGESKKGNTSHRSKSQSKSEDEESSMNTSFELDVKKTQDDMSFSPSLYGKPCPPELEPLELSSPPDSALLKKDSPFGIDNSENERIGFRRSQTLNLKISLGSASASVSRRESKRLSKFDLKIARSPGDAQALNALREKVGKIKELQTMIKGWDVLKIHAEMVDNFLEFSSEARVAFEEGKREVEYFMDKISTSKKFEDNAKEFLVLSADKLEKMRLIELSKKELKNLELITYDTSESNKEDSGMLGMNLDVKSSWDSIDMIPNTDSSPGVVGRNSFSLSKTISESPERKKSGPTPEDSPVTRKARKLRSRSVGKSNLNHRYKMFEKNLQKIIKNLKREKESAGNSPSKVTRSQFYRNSLMSLVFEEDLTEEPIEPKSVEEVRVKGRKSSYFSHIPQIESIQEKINGESEIITESSDEDSDDSSDNEEDEDHNDDMILEAENLEKSFFSDDESNLKRCAKKQEDGLSSIITISDFEFVKIISKGAYGRVWLVQRKITGDYYAMKIIDFAERKNMNQIDSLKKEKKVFEVIKGDFVVKAVFTFVHNNCLCIVMEFMIGGDFSSILEKFGALDEDVAKFYIAEMVEALSNLHQLGIVHRDLKPDNILLNKNGHIKLTDFGLSEVGIQKHTKTNNSRKRSSIFNSLTPDRRLSIIVPNSNAGICKKHFDKPSPSILSDQFSTIPEVDEDAGDTQGPRKGNRIVGTPDYMAPEVITGACYDDPCIDWWSVGVILFEFIVGIPPFNDSCKEGVFSNILRRNIPWSELQIGYDEGCVTPEAKDLIDRLLESDRSKRLGVKGVDEIKNHPFFKGINWTNIVKSKAPIIPITENDVDVSNFEKESKTFHASELESPFLERSPKGAHPVNISLNKATFEFARVDILHEENQKVVQEATNTINPEELEKMRNERLKNRKWSVFD